MQNLYNESIYGTDGSIDEKENMMNMIFVIIGAASIFITLLMPALYFRYKSFRQHPSQIFCLMAICESISCYLYLMSKVTDNIQFFTRESEFYETLWKTAIFNFG